MTDRFDSWHKIIVPANILWRSLDIADLKSGVAKHIQISLAVERWCARNCNGPWNLIYLDSTLGSSYLEHVDVKEPGFLFRCATEDDVVIFKLRWL